MSVSIKEVAILAGVSIATVSHVINGTRSVREETRKKVEHAIQVLNYQVNTAGRTLRSGKSRIIGYVVSHLSSNFYMYMGNAINSVLSEAGYSIIYADSKEDPKIEEQNIRSMIQQNVDGLIIVPVNHDCSYLERIIQGRCPCIFLGRKPIGYDSDAVLAKNFEAVYEAIEHLLNLGHTRIGYLAARSNSTALERLEGYRAIMHEKGIPVLDSWIKIGKGNPEIYKEQKYGESYYLTEELMKNEGITALFIADGLSSVGAINYLFTHHYHIPNDVAVITYDDAFWLSMTIPTFTVTDQDTSGLGRMAAEVLLKRINGSDDPFEVYRIPNKLIIRESC